MNGFLEYVPGESLLHRLNPLVKLLAAALFAIACFCTSNLAFLAAMLAASFALAGACGMVPQALRLARAVALFSLVLAAVQVLTTPSGAMLVALPWGYIGTGSLLAALTTVVRLIAAAVPLFLVFYVTRVGDMVNAAVKMLHVPYRYAFAFSTTVRFIPMFLGDMKGVMEAQTARGVRFDEGGIVGKARLAAPLCIPLLMSSVRKAGNAAIAAEVRGFDLRTAASGVKGYPLAARDAAVLGVAAALLAAAIALTLLG